MPPLFAGPRGGSGYCPDVDTVLDTVIDTVLDNGHRVKKYAEGQPKGGMRSTYIIQANRRRVLGLRFVNKKHVPAHVTMISMRLKP